MTSSANTTIFLLIAICTYLSPSCCRFVESFTIPSLSSSDYSRTMMTFQPTTSTTIIKSSTSLFMSDAALTLTNGKEGVYFYTRYRLSFLRDESYVIILCNTRVMIKISHLIVHYCCYFSYLITFAM